MLTLEQKIALMLQEEQAESLEEAKKGKMEELDDETGEESEDDVEVDPKMKKKEKCDEETVEETAEEIVAEEEEQVEESNKAKVSEQVSALLEAEGLSEDFKVQAVAIFEAAVADRVLEVKSQLDEEYEIKLNEAKAELSEQIDGYLGDAVVNWVNENRVPLTQSFKADLAESFIDGLRQLFVEHNVVVPEESEDALNIALSANEKLEAQIAEAAEATKALQEELNQIKKAKVLESVKSSMTTTEADRFDALIESIDFVNEAQYTKQLQIVKENFTVKAKETAKPVISESTEVQAPAASGSMANYVEFLSKLK